MPRISNGSNHHLEKRDAGHQLHVGAEVPATALVNEDDSYATLAALVYREKVAVLNDAIQETGMGRYQW